MTGIERLLPTPERRFSRIVAYGDLVFLAGVTAPEPRDDVFDQCRQVLARIDDLLHQAASDKHHILSATIWLADITQFERMNEAWDAWVSHDAPPARATVEAKLARSQLLIEISIIAARAIRHCEINGRVT